MTTQRRTMATQTMGTPIRRIPYLPVELIDLCISFISNPIDRFQAATSLRYLFIRNKTIPCIRAANPDKASAKGQTDLLSWWATSNLPLYYSSLALNRASEEGHTHVLNFWKSTGLALKYTSYALNSASGQGHSNILDWWLTTLPATSLKYTKFALDTASKNNHVHILQWWKTSGLKLVYTHNAMDWASAHNHVNVLDWWVASGLELKYSEMAMDGASEEGHVDVLEWWISSGLKLKWTHFAMEAAFSNGRLEVLEWWERVGLEKDFKFGVVESRCFWVKDWWGSIGNLAYCSADSRDASQIVLRRREYSARPPTPPRPPPPPPPQPIIQEPQAQVNDTKVIAAPRRWHASVLRSHTYIPS